MGRCCPYHARFIETPGENLLKEWVMIHHIKSLYANGAGLTIRAIAQQLNISRNTVRKYLRLDEAEISRRQDDHGTPLKTGYGR